MSLRSKYANLACSLLLTFLVILSMGRLWCPKLLAKLGSISLTKLLHQMDWEVQEVLQDQMDLSWATELEVHFPIISPKKQPSSIQLYFLLKTIPSNYSMALKVLQNQVNVYFPNVFPWLFHVQTIFSLLQGHLHKDSQMFTCRNYL
jgi:hypothetical protein